MRVGLRPTPWIVQLRAGQQRRRDDERRRRGEVARDVDLARARSRSAGPTATLPRRRVHRARRPRASIRSVWSRVGDGLDDGRRAVGVEAREQDARLHLGARDRQLVADRRAARRPSMRERQAARPSVSTRAPICGERLGDPLHRPRAEATRRRSARSAALLPGEDPGEQPQRACRRCRSRSAAGASRSPRRPAPATRSVVDVVLVDRDAERADGRDRRLGVGRAAEARDRASRRRRSRRAAPRGARSTCRRARRCARRAAVAARSSFGRAPARRRRRSPAPRAAPPRARPRPRRSTSSVSVPPRSGETWWSSKSSMLIRSAPSACVIPASTPGRSGTCTAQPLQLARVARSASASIRRRLPAASPIQRARKPASPRVERRLELLDPAAVLGERLARARRALSRKMSTQMRGFAPATRVMSRSEPPAAASGSWPSIARRAGLVDEQVRERVRQVARQRDEPVVRLPGRSRPARRRARRRSRARAGSGAGRSSVSGVRNQVAPSKSSALACSGAARLGAADRVAADEARRAAAAAQTPPFVEPTSVTVRLSPLASSTARTWRGRAGRPARRRRRGRRRRPHPRASPPARRPRRARAAAASAAGSGSQPTTRADAGAAWRASADRGPDQARADRPPALPTSTGGRLSRASRAGPIPNPHPPRENRG